MTLRVGVTVLAVAATAVWAFLNSDFTRWHCVRCADQRTTLDVFGFPIPIEPHYDEYGIVEKWERAHGRPCKNIWRPGSFDPMKRDKQYWPDLHFAAATNTPIDELARRLETVSAEELRRRDALGRTVLHWLAVHRDVEGRKRLIARLVSRGVWHKVPDEDGLLPTQWAYRNDPAAFVRSPVIALSVSETCEDEAAGTRILFRGDVDRLVGLGFDDESRTLWIKATAFDFAAEWEALPMLEFRAAPPPSSSYLMVVWALTEDRSSSPFPVGLIDEACLAKVRARYQAVLRIQTIGAISIERRAVGQ